MSANDGGTAFPVSRQSFGNGITLEPMSEGMTLRDWFAGMALQSIIICLKGEKASDEQVSLWAYESADAMLAARERKEDA